MARGRIFQKIGPSCKQSSCVLGSADESRDITAACVSGIAVSNADFRDQSWL
jgi:hypothetical protein